MGWLTNMKKGARAVGHGVMTSARATLKGANPISATLQGGFAAANYSGGSGGGLPGGLPPLGAYGLPALPSPTGTGGVIKAYPVPGGDRRMPIPLPTTTQDFQQWHQMGFWLPLTQTPTQYNPPRNFVMVGWQTAGGMVRGCMRRELAMKLGLWRPAHKPPISVGVHQAMKKAVHGIERMKDLKKLVNTVHRNLDKHGHVKKLKK